MKTALRTLLLLLAVAKIATAETTVNQYYYLEFDCTTYEELQNAVDVVESYGVTARDVLPPKTVIAVGHRRPAWPWAPPRVSRSLAMCNISSRLRSLISGTAYRPPADEDHGLLMIKSLLDERREKNGTRQQCARSI